MKTSVGLAQTVLATILKYKQEKICHFSDIIFHYNIQGLCNIQQLWQGVL